MNIKETMIDCLSSSIDFYRQHKYIAFLKKDKEKDKILSSSPNMLMTMWVMSANFDAEKASEIPFILNERLNMKEFDIEKIANTSIEELENAMLYPKPIHRFCKKRAGYLKELAVKIVNEYNSDAGNIWKNASADEIKRRLLTFKGFGPKLSNMVPINLIRNFGMKLRNIDSMDIAVDVHVERVLKRTGIVDEGETDKGRMALEVRNLAATQGILPMELDLPLWASGKFFCHAYAPDCSGCPLSASCPRIQVKPATEGTGTSCH